MKQKKKKAKKNLLFIACVIVSSLSVVVGLSVTIYSYSNPKRLGYNLRGLINDINVSPLEYNEVRSLIYPVGSVYISVTDNTVAKVEERFGGEWEAFGTGKALIGVDGNNTNFDTVEETGGSSTTTITVENLPDHEHKYTPAGTNSYTTSNVTTGNQSAIPTISNNGYKKEAITGGSHSHGVGDNKQFLAIKGGTQSATTSGFTAANYLWGGANKQLYSSTNTSTHKHDLPNHTHTLTGNHTHTISAANLKTAIGTITFTGTEKSTTACTNCSATALDVQNSYVTVYMYKRVS